VNPKHRNLATRSVLALSVLTGAGLLAAAPARASDEFANAFQDELGRAVAHEVVRAGAMLLYGPYYAAPVVYAAPRPIRTVVYESRHRHGHTHARCAHGHRRHALHERAKHRRDRDRRHR